MRQRHVLLSQRPLDGGERHAFGYEHHNIGKGTLINVTTYGEIDRKPASDRDRRRDVHRHVRRRRGLRPDPPDVDVLELIVRGISQQPRAIDGQIEVRDVLNLTLAIDHDVIDGGPAARFAAELRDVVETAAVLTDPVTIHEGATSRDHDRH